LSTGLLERALVSFTSPPPMLQLAGRSGITVFGVCGWLTQLTCDVPAGAAGHGNRPVCVAVPEPVLGSAVRGGHDDGRLSTTADAVGNVARGRTAESDEVDAPEAANGVALMRTATMTGVTLRLGRRVFWPSPRQACSLSSDRHLSTGQMYPVHRLRRRDGAGGIALCRQILTGRRPGLPQSGGLVTRLRGPTADVAAFSRAGSAPPTDFQPRVEGKRQRRIQAGRFRPAISIVSRYVSGLSRHGTTCGPSAAQALTALAP